MLYSFHYGDKIKNWIIGFIIIMNTVVGIKYYLPFVLEYGTSYSLKSNLMTAQTSYTYDTVESDVIIPLLIRDKRVYISKDSEYKKYVDFFTEIVLIEELDACDYDTLTRDFMDFGEMAPNALDFYYEGISDEVWDQLYGNRAHVYVSSNDIIDSNELVLVNDSNMNLFVMTCHEYNTRCNR